MKILFSILFSTTFFISQHVVAHGEYGHEAPRVISEPVALIVAKRTSANMSRKDTGLGVGQLSESWSSIPKENLALVKKGASYYLVSVTNTVEEKTLYVLMSDAGEVYNANFTGEFDSIK